MKKNERYSLKTHFNIQSSFISRQICFRSQVSKFLLYSTNMAWIRLIFVVFCIGSIHGLPQDMRNPSDDSKPSDLTKNLLNNPSLVDSKSSDLMDIVIFALKMAVEFIWNKANCYFTGTGFKPQQEVDPAILGNCYDWNPESFFYAFEDAFLYVFISLWTHITILIHNGPL